MIIIKTYFLKFKIKICAADSTSVPGMYKRYSNSQCALYPSKHRTSSRKYHFPQQSPYFEMSIKRKDRPDLIQGGKVLLKQTAGDRKQVFNSKQTVRFVLAVCKIVSDLNTASQQKILQIRCSSQSLFVTSRHIIHLNSRPSCRYPTSSPVCHHFCHGRPLQLKCSQLFRFTK